MLFKRTLRKIWTGRTGWASRFIAAHFDCVAFFNPTTFADYEATVNGWADALLVFINASVTGSERKVSLEV